MHFGVLVSHDMGCALGEGHMTKLITNYPLVALILIWVALIGVICILPGTDTVVAHNLPDRY